MELEGRKEGRTIDERILPLGRPRARVTEGLRLTTYLPRTRGGAETNKRCLSILACIIVVDPDTSRDISIPRTRPSIVGGKG